MMSSWVFLNAFVLIFTAVRCAEVTYYADGESAATIQTLIDDNNGAWTIVFDRDSPSYFGEFEHVYMQQRKDAQDDVCKMFCDDPIAMTVDASPMGDVTDYSAVEQCTVIVNDGDPSYGFKCRAAEMEDSDPSQACLDLCAANGMTDEDAGSPNCDVCPDINVKYFCKGSAQDRQDFCSSAKKRFLGEEDEYMEWTRSGAKREQKLRLLKAKKETYKKKSMDKLLARLLKALE